MTTIIIDNVKHEEKNLTDVQKNLLQDVSINQNALKLFTAVVSSLQKEGAVKLGDLREALATVTKKSNVKGK